MEIEQGAPVSYSQSIEINASIQTIWKIMTDIENWPSWNEDIKSATLNGKLTIGTTFTWKSGPGTITSTLEAVNKPNLLGWSGKLFGIKAVHIWKIKSVKGKSIVTTEESWSGLYASLFKRRSKKTLIKAIDTGLNRLKSAAEYSRK
ncbi:SRPBCC family protein [Candidatus Saccharibacteria bacterium]|nr:SRPBCC family protein [Candidatus Saccharibacteria bacterium]